MSFIDKLISFRFNTKNFIHWFVLAVFTVAICAFAYKNGQKIDITSDFAVFWNAGNNFTDGVSLYSGIGGACRFIYPPFAAMCFQFLSIFEIHHAATLCTLINFFIWLLIVVYSYRVLLLFGFTKKQLYPAFILGFLLSMRFFMYHLKFVQLNELVLLLTLMGIYYHLKNKDFISVSLLVLAVFIKILPVFILVWVLSKRINIKTYLFTFGCFVLGIAIPFLQRGYDQGMLDLQEYYVSFLEPFQNGAVEPKLQNYGLSAALYKMFSTTQDGVLYGYTLTILPLESIAIINKILLVLLLLLYASLLVLARFVFKTVSVYEICFILLFTHLVSGITWEYHLVTLFFIYVVFALRYFDTRKHKIFWAFLLLIAIFNAIIGGDTVGYYLYFKACGLSLITWFMLGLSVLSFIYFVRDKKRIV